VARPRRAVLEAAVPLSPRRKWLAITAATLAFVPAYWSVLAGIVSSASPSRTAPDPGAALALGLALIPFVFIVLAFASGHPRAPGAVVKAMLLALLVGIPVSALAGDGITGMIAGVSAGGAAALRLEPNHSWKARAVAVAVATVYTFVLIRLGGDVIVLGAPVLPFTALGVADHIVERRRERSAAERTEEEGAWPRS
jgi:hypothetical protein